MSDKTIESCKARFTIPQEGRMSFKPYVGQKVRLSRFGYEELRLRSREEFLDAEDLTITSVSDINAGSGAEPIWVIDVDKPSIDRFLLDSDMVEPR